MLPAAGGQPRVDDIISPAYFPHEQPHHQAHLLMSVNASHCSFCCLSPFFFSLFSPKRFWDQSHPSSGPHTLKCGPGSAHPCLVTGIPRVTGVIHTRQKSSSFQTTATVPRGQQERQAGKSCSKFLLLSLRDSSNSGKPAERLSQSRRRSKEPQDPAAPNS